MSDDVRFVYPLQRLLRDARELEGRREDLHRHATTLDQDARTGARTIRRRRRRLGGLLRRVRSRYRLMRLRLRG